MLYAIQAQHTEFVKIGVTAGETVKQRIQNMQTACPHKLVVLASADWPHYIEHKIHRRLSKLHVRGEWFTLGPDALEVVDIMRDGMLHEMQRFLGLDLVAPQHRLAKALKLAQRVQNEPDFLTSRLAKNMNAIDYKEE